MAGGDDRAGLLAAFAGLRVADGDAVIAVPREAAMEVAGHADAERRRDTAARRKLYDQLGMAADETVIEPEEPGQ